MPKVSEKDLKHEIRDMRERYPALKEDELFVAWFLKCFVCNNEEDAVGALVGSSGDKNLDAIHIDDHAKSVFVVQGKYRSTGSLEKRNDVIGFAELGNVLSNPSLFSDYSRKLNPESKAKAKEAHKRITTRGYRSQLYYVTSGRCSEQLRKEAERLAKRTRSETRMEVVDGKHVLRLLADYLDGVAPPVPMLELEIENGSGVKLDSVLQRFDEKTSIESWVVPVSVKQIAEMYDQSGVRLFARNVRGFLGDTEINRSMESTLSKEPSFFWYYNNGITIVCDHAEMLKQAGRSVMRVVNPQVINGQQTTRTLHENAKKGSKAAVLVRVISVPRDGDGASAQFEYLVSKIVSATNWQNAIRQSDLIANDRRQIEIERNLRRRAYQYLRKRQTKGEARRSAGVRHRFIVTKEAIAQASAACDLDPSIVRHGKEGLFEDRYYSQVFPNSDPLYYLPRWWLVVYVSYAAKGYPERAYAKWVVTHFLWQRFQSDLSKKQLREVFIKQSEREWSSGLLNACNTVHKAATALY